MQNCRVPGAFSRRGVGALPLYTQTGGERERYKSGEREREVR
jgi:hypothetical protein